MKKVNEKKWKVALISVLAVALSIPSVFAGSGQNKVSTVGWQQVLLEDFETDFPPGWNRTAEMGNYTWGRSDYIASHGTWSIWCAKKALNGAPSRFPTGNYPNNIISWATYGPIDLRNCTAANITFDMYYLMSDNDKVEFLVDCGTGWQGFAYKGNSEGWKDYKFDLSLGPWGNALWNSDVYIAFKFTSNAAGGTLGAFVDSVTVQRYFTGWPDLTISQLVIPESAIQGQDFVVNCTISNPEINDAQSTQATVYLTADKTVDTEVDLTLGLVDIPALAGGSSYSFTEPYPAPMAVPAGEYYIAVMVDPRDNIAENSNDNNLSFSDSKINLQAFSGWDVILDEGFEPTEFPNGLWTRNPGGGNYSWARSAYKSFEGSASIWCNGANFNGAPNVRPESGHALNSDAWVIYGPVDMTVAENADLSFAFWQGISDRNDKLKVLVSAGGPWQGYEYNTNSYGWAYEQLDLMAWPGFGSLKGLNVFIAFNFTTNNTGIDVGTFVDKVIVRKQFENPDLVCVSLTETPAELAPGGQMNISSTVRNIGSAASGATEMKIYLSADATVSDADLLLATNTVGPLGVNGDSPYTNAVTIPANQAEGTYYIGVIVDPGNLVSENSEDNNKAVTQTPFTVVIPKPDLTCTSVSGTPASLDAGGTLQINANISNIGTGNAGASKVKLVLSTDQTVSAGDTEIGILDVNALNAGAMQNVSTTYVLPADLATGTYYIGATADAQSAVTETDESNNTAISTGISVTKQTNAVSTIAPQVFALDQNYPNPFNPQTTIRFSVPRTAEVSLVITNVYGQTIRVLVNRTMESGYHEVAWDGTNQNGDKVASGIYFYQIESGSFKELRKMILVQ